MQVPGNPSTPLGDGSTESSPLPNPGRSVSLVLSLQTLQSTVLQREASMPASTSTIQKRLFLGVIIGTHFLSWSACRKFGSASGWHSPPVPLLCGLALKSCTLLRK